MDKNRKKILKNREFSSCFSIENELRPRPFFMLASPNLFVVKTKDSVILRKDETNSVKFTLVMSIGPISQSTR